MAAKRGLRKHLDDGNKKSRRRSTDIVDKIRRIKKKKGTPESGGDIIARSKINSMLRNYYHEIEIAAARVDSVLSKLDAPPQGGRSELASEIVTWQSELRLDDHPEYARVRFAEAHDATNKLFLQREIERLQDNIESDVKTDQIRSVLNWSLKKKDRSDAESRNFYQMDRDNADLGNLLYESEMLVDSLGNDSKNVYTRISEMFGSAMKNRRDQWFESLRTKARNVQEAKQKETRERERQLNLILKECAEHKEKIKVLDNAIMKSGVKKNMESDSYIALTKKHEQKQEHLMEIIDRQQHRISVQGNKVAALTEEESELQVIQADAPPNSYSPYFLRSFSFF